MIYIYKSSENIDITKLLYNVSSYFNGYITSKEFDDKELNAMKIIDNAKLVDKNIGTIVTPRGVTDIDHLSSGCKTVITYIKMLKGEISDKTFIDISSCGINAIEYIFSLADKYDKDGKIKFVLRHKDRICECKDREYNIDGAEKISDLTFM